MQPRHNMQPRDRHLCADAQAPADLGTRSRHGDRRIVRVIDDFARPFIEMLPGLGRGQPSCGTHQQAHTEPPFEVRDGFGHRRLADLEIPRRR